MFKQRNNQIDGLRAFSFLLVFLYHADYIEAGYIGVDLFFILSGYLMTLSITSIRKREGTRGILTFANKRIARLVPSILVLVCFTCFFSYLIIPDSDRAEVLRTGLTILIMATNYYLALSQDYFGVAAIFNPFTHMWSISAEMHFYLIIGILGFVFRFKPVGWIFICSILIGLTVYLGGESSQTYLFSHTRIFSFLAGSGLFFLTKHLQIKLKNINIPVLILYVLIALCSLIKLPSLFMGMDWLVNSLLANIFGFSLLFLIINDGNKGDTHLVNSKIYNGWIYIGRISYSLYLFHYPVISFSFWLWGDLSPLTLILTLLVSIGLAVLNYNLVESRYFALSSSKFEKNLYPTI